jgi:hypothetical protein
MRTIWGVGIFLLGCSFDPRALDRTPFEQLETAQCGYYLAVAGEKLTPAPASEERPCYRLTVTNDSWLTRNELSACDVEEQGLQCVVVPGGTRIYHWLDLGQGDQKSYLTFEAVACSEGC